MTNKEIVNALLKQETIDGSELPAIKGLENCNKHNMTHKFALLKKGPELLELEEELENGNWDTPSVISEKVKIKSTGIENSGDYTPDEFCKRMEISHEEFQQIATKIAENYINAISDLKPNENNGTFIKNSITFNVFENHEIPVIKENFGKDDEGNFYIKNGETYSFLNVEKTGKFSPVNGDIHNLFRKIGLDNTAKQWIPAMRKIAKKTWLELGTIEDTTTLHDKILKKFKEANIPSEIIKNCRLDFYEKKLVDKFPVKDQNGVQVLDEKGEPVMKKVENIIPSALVINYCPISPELNKQTTLDYYVLERDLNRIAYDYAEYGNLKRVLNFSNKPNEAKNYQPYDMFENNPLFNGMDSDEILDKMPEAFKEFFKPIIKVQIKSQFYYIAAWIRNAISAQNTEGRQALMIQGKGRNGKDVFTTVLREILNAHSQNFVGDCDEQGFKSDNIQNGFCKNLGNHIVIIPDIDKPNDLLGNGFFKKLTGGSIVTIQQKYLKPISFNGKGMKFIMVTNNSLYYSGKWATSRILPVYFSEINDNEVIGDIRPLRIRMIEQGDEFLSWCVNFANAVDKERGIIPSIQDIPVFSFEHPEWDNLNQDARYKNYCESLSDAFNVDKRDEYADSELAEWWEAFNNRYIITNDTKHRISSSDMKRVLGEECEKLTGLKNYQFSGGSKGFKNWKTFMADMKEKYPVCEEKQARVGEISTKAIIGVMDRLNQKSLPYIKAEQEAMKKILDGEDNSFKNL